MNIIDNNVYKNIINNHYMSEISWEFLNTLSSTQQV